MSKSSIVNASPREVGPMKLSLLSLMILFSALPIHSAHAATCDPTLMGEGSFYGDADSAAISSPSSLNYGTSIMGYDYHQGRFFGHCTSCFDNTNIQGSDTYRIQGGIAGVPIHIHVEFLAVWGWGSFYDCSHCGMETYGLSVGLRSSQTIHSGAQNVSAEYCDCGGGGTKSLGLDLTVLPDEDFVLTYNFYSGHAPSPEGGHAEATVHFSGIPADAQLVSCHGVNDGVVATMPSTWGRLKAAYR
jgi:hypothetical protein